ncbi:MAG TPA: PLP-dependent aminotransferase family protein, partial [Gemmatimonadales bacterium]|nr:PLP-dependent aminotransferase family protein [Gemmatimonadales bacterium]
MTTLLLSIERGTGRPIHRQVYDGLRQAVLDGRLRPGQRVPSTRALAVELAVSRLPVLAAYDQLLHEGYLTGRVGSGTFVSDALPDDLLAPRPAGTAAVPRRVPGNADPDAGEGGLGPFRLSLPALDRFPHRRWSRLVARHARGLTPAHMGYGDPAGLPSLRAAIADHLRAARAVRCEAAQVLVVPGSQAALRVATAALLAPGDRVAVEEPGYPDARAALGSGGAELVSVPVDEEGMSVAALERLRGRVRAVHVTPSHQYPLGVSMSASRRLALLEWANRRGAWVLEDDYDSEYRYVSRPLGALQGMDSHQRVIYVGTFSKVLFPALRIGYLVVPRALRQRFVEAREAFDLFSPTLYQLALVDFLREGHFARHLRRMRPIYLRRRAALIDGVKRHCDGRLHVHNADAGLHITTFLAAGIDDLEVLERMTARGLTATTLSTCY